MDVTRASLLVLLFFVAHISLGLSGSATVPAFLWSSHQVGSSHHEGKEFVDYRIMSPTELASSVLSEGGWSKIMCPGKDLQPNVDIALVFVGKMLKSSDISKNGNVDPALVEFLKLSVTSSNFSMAFPYIAKSNEETVENSIISEFVENCGHGLLNHVASSEACTLDGEGITKLKNLQSVQDYLSSKVNMRMNGKADLIVFCGEDNEKSEGKIFSDLVNFLQKLRVRYTILYASDHSKLYNYPPHGYRTLDRFLAEDSLGNISFNSTRCDGVCQIKSSLLEGVFVGIVLLIILLSGLCCMMGIDTPTRFETPQES